MNFQTIGYIERGEYNPSLELGLTMAVYIGVPVEAMFSRTPFTPMSTLLYGEPGQAAQANEPVKRSNGR